MGTNVKTTIPISVDLIRKIEAVAKRQHQKSKELIEKVLSDYAKIAKIKRQTTEIKKLNQVAV